VAVVKMASGISQHNKAVWVLYHVPSWRGLRIFDNPWVTVMQIERPVTGLRSAVSFVGWPAGAVQVPYRIKVRLVVLQRCGSGYKT
jgi:hypothetical protein